MQQLSFPQPTLVKDNFFGGESFNFTPSPEALGLLGKVSPDADILKDAVEIAPDSNDPDDSTEGSNSGVNFGSDVDALLNKFAPSPEVIANEPLLPITPVTPDTTPAVKPVDVALNVPIVPATTDAGAAASSDGDITDIATVANFLMEKGLIVDIPENFPVQELTSENFWELLELNVGKKIEVEYESGYGAARNDIANALLPEIFDIVNFQLENPNADPEEVRMHIDYVLYQKEVNHLDPANPVDAETILREFHKGEYTAEEITDKINMYRQHNLLQREAELVKPKLEGRLAQIGQAKQSQRLAEKQQGEALHRDFMTKVDKILQKGEINGIKIDNEAKSALWGIFSNNKTQVPVPGGRPVEMNLINLLVAKNMYGTDANHENLMLAALILKDGKAALDKYVSAPVIKKEVVAFRTQATTGNFRAAGSSTSTTKDKPGEAAKTTNTSGFFTQKLR